MTFTRMVAAVVLVVTLCARSHALVLCQQKNGAVTARDTCRKKERPVDVAALAPLGPSGAPGSTGATGAPGTFPLRLVDGAGVDVGTIVQLHPIAALVEMSQPVLGGQKVLFQVEPGGFTRNTAGAISNVLYASSDCSGVPLIKEQPGAIAAQVYGNSAYFSTEPSSSRTFGSSEQDPGDGPCTGGAVATARGTCCSTVSGMQSVQAAVRVALSALGVSPPFRAVPR